MRGKRRGNAEEGPDANRWRMCSYGTAFRKGSIIILNIRRQNYMKYRDETIEKKKGISTRRSHGKKKNIIHHMACKVTQKTSLFINNAKRYDLFYIFCLLILYLIVTFWAPLLLSMKYD